MEILGWKWIGIGGGYNEGVPSIDDLKQKAKELLIDACWEKTNVATGGFQVEYEKEDGEDKQFLHLVFQLEEVEGYIDDDDE